MIKTTTLDNIVDIYIYISCGATGVPQRKHVEFYEGMRIC
jgi:hypothetical protein